MNLDLTRPCSIDSTAPTRAERKDLVCEWVCAHPGVDDEDVSDELAIPLLLAVELVGELLAEGRLEFAEVAP